MRNVVAGIAFALVVTACGGSGGVDQDASGEQIFLAVCARCHAADLSGGVGPPLAGDDAPSLGLPESYFLQTVTRGKGRMPAWGGILSEEQIRRVVEFILEQQGR